MKFSIENWQQVVPRDKWRDFALEEAQHSAMAVNAWLDDPANMDMLDAAVSVRNEFVQHYIERENIDTTILNMVPYGIDQDVKIRLQMISELAYTAEQILSEITTPTPDQNDT